MGDRPRGSALGIATDLIVIGVALLLLVRPDASLRDWWQQRNARIDMEQRVAAAWPELIREGGRIGSQVADGPVIIEFGDYECPFCKMSHKALDTLLLNNPELTVIYRHMPLPQLHPMAEEAARASICAEQAGFFGALHSFLYEADEWKDNPAWADIARDLEVASEDAFIECMASGAATARLERDLALVQQLALDATPSFVGPAGIRVGALDQAALERLLERGPES